MTEVVDGGSEEMAFCDIQGYSRMLIYLEDVFDVFEVSIKGIRVNYNVFDIDQEHGSLLFVQEKIQGFLEGH